jgi:hypothetical protein
MPVVQRAGMQLFELRNSIASGVALQQGWHVFEVQAAAGGDGTVHPALHTVQVFQVLLRELLKLGGDVNLHIGSGMYVFVCSGKLQHSRCVSEVLLALPAVLCM